MMVQTEIGLLPEDWEVKTIGECASLKAGDIVDVDTTSRKIYPCFGGNGIRGFVSKYTHEGTFPIIGRQGEWCGNVNLASGRFYATEHAVVARPNKTTDAVCLYYFLKDANLNQYATGCAQPGLSVQNINKILIPLPKDKSEQQNIATVLSSIDKLIDDLGRTIQKKQRIREGAMEELLSGKKRLPGFTEEWKRYELQEIGIFSKGQGIKRDQSQSGKIPCVRYGELYTDHNNYVREFKSFISQEIAITSKRIKYGDILFAGSGETKEEIGKAAAIVYNTEAYAGGDVIIFTPKVESDPYFFGFLMNAEEVVKQKATMGQGDAVVHIHAAELARVQIPVPSIKEQHAIADILTSMDDEISLLESERAKYEQIRSGMMEELLTGKKRLK